MVPFEGSTGAGAASKLIHRGDGRVFFLERFWIEHFSSLLAVGRPPHSLLCESFLGAADSMTVGFIKVSKGERMYQGGSDNLL